MRCLWLPRHLIPVLGVTLWLVGCQPVSPVSNTHQTNGTAMNSPLITAINPTIAIEGRSQTLDDGSLLIGYPGVSLHTHFEGQHLSLVAQSSGTENELEVLVEGETPRTIRLTEKQQEWVLIDAGQVVHRDVRIINRGETWLGRVTLQGFITDAGAHLSRPERPTRKLLIVGDSVTCSYGAGDRSAPLNTAPWWNPRASYGMRLADSLNAQVHLVCYGGRGLIRSWNGNTDEGNAPEFFEWTIADKANPVTWDHDQYSPDLILVSLGTNDFSLGIGPLPERQTFVTAYVDFLKRLRAVHPEAVIALTDGSIVNDNDDPARPQKSVLRQYIQEAIQRFDEPNVYFIPAHHYPGDAKDGHPTAAQHAKMARELADQLSPIMNW